MDEQKPATTTTSDIIDLDLEPDEPTTPQSASKSSESSDTPTPKRQKLNEEDTDADASPEVDFESLIEQQKTSQAADELPVLETPQRTRSKRLRNVEAEPSESAAKKSKLTSDEPDTEDADSPDKEVETIMLPEKPLKEAIVVVEEISLDALEVATPPVKRGRGRPKKIVKPTPIVPPKKESSAEEGANEKENIETPSKSVDPLANILGEGEATTPKKTPGRGRGRGSRGGRVVQVVKDGKVTQVKMDAGYEDDDSPTFSLYNRYGTPRGRGRGRGRRGRGHVPRGTPDRGRFMTPVSD